MSLLDDWGVPTMSSSGTHSSGAFQNDAFSGLASPGLPPGQPAVGGFQASQGLGFGVQQPQMVQPSQNPTVPPSQGQMAPGNPFVAGGGLPPTVPISGVAMAPAAGTRPPPQRPVSQAYNRRISDPFGDMISELIPTK